MDVAQKIKADLIMRSKLKKSYAKVVQEEGVQSNRLKPRTGAAGTSAAAAEASSEAGPSSSRSTEGGEREKGGRAGSLKRKFSGQGETGRPSKFRREKGTGEAGDDDVLNRTESANSTKRKVRALSPGDIGPPMPQSSLIELKKEAFAKYHSPHSRSTSATTGVGRGGGRSVSGGSTRSTGSSGLFGGGGGGKKGQPNMGARMGLLLEKIKRDRA